MLQENKTEISLALRSLWPVWMFFVAVAAVLGWFGYTSFQEVKESVETHFKNEISTGLLEKGKKILDIKELRTQYQKAVDDLPGDNEYKDLKEIYLNIIKLKHNTRHISESINNLTTLQKEEIVEILMVLSEAVESGNTLNVTPENLYIAADQALTLGLSDLASKFSKASVEKNPNRVKYKVLSVTTGFMNQEISAEEALSELRNILNESAPIEIHLVVGALWNLYTEDRRESFRNEIIVILVDDLMTLRGGLPPPSYAILTIAKLFQLSPKESDQEKARCYLGLALDRWLDEFSLAASAWHEATRSGMLELTEKMGETYLHDIIILSPGGEEIGGGVLRSANCLYRASQRPR